MSLAKVLDKTFTGLLPWILLVALFFFLYSLVMLTTTMIYALGVSFFKDSPASRSRVAALLVIPVWIGSVMLQNGPLDL